MGTGVALYPKSRRRCHHAVGLRKWMPTSGWLGPKHIIGNSTTAGPCREETLPVL